MSLTRKDGELRALACFRSQTTRGTARHRTPRGQLISRDRRTVLDGADHRRFIHAVSIGHRGETLLATHLVDQALLAPGENGVREYGEVAEHPQQINALPE